MGWRERRQPASFKGVPFEVATDSQPAGPRTQVHEYPQRDKPFVEPLGLKAREIKVAAFVAGDDCLDRRDALLKVINEPGAGELIHPWLGSLTVSCTGCDYSHDRGAMGVVRFDLTFVEGESDPSYPVAGEDVASVLNSAADGVQTSALGRFTDALDAIDLSQVNLPAVMPAVSAIVATLQDVYGSASGVLDSADGVIGRLLAGPLDFANTLFGAVREAVSSFSGFYGRVSGAPSLFGLGGRVDALRRLADVAIPAGGINGTFVRATQALGQDVVVADVIRGVSTFPARVPASAVAGVMAVGGMTPRAVDVAVSGAHTVVGDVLGASGVAPPVADDVLALRGELTDAFWSVAEQSPAAHYERLAAGRAAVARQLTSVARLGVQLTQIENPATVSALVLAYRRYGDATRSADIVARNGVHHPGFVPAGAFTVPRV
ncbi:DNA circularization protein [Castellaniella sp. UC4442_H9]